MLKINILTNSPDVKNRMVSTNFSEKSFHWKGQHVVGIALLWISIPTNFYGNLFNFTYFIYTVYPHFEKPAFNRLWRRVRGLA